MQDPPLWERRDNGMKLAREFSFASFPDAISFMNAVAALAEEADHHPDIHVRYKKVLLELSTHSAGGVTEKDLTLAARIDALTA